MHLLFGVEVLLQVAVAAHAVHRGRMSWVWIILCFPVVGPILYVVSHARLDRAAPPERPGLRRVEPGPFARTGTRPDDAIEVDSPSQIESRAAREDCPECGSVLKVLEHRAERIAGRDLRVVCLECSGCGALPVRYFRLSQAAVSSSRR